MDDFTERHFRRWLDQTVPLDDREMVEASIRKLLAKDHDLLEGRSWPELREHAEILSRRRLEA